MVRTASAYSTTSPRTILAIRMIPHKGHSISTEGFKQNELHVRESSEHSHEMPQSSSGAYEWYLLCLQAKHPFVGQNKLAMQLSYMAPYCLYPQYNVITLPCCYSDETKCLLCFESQSPAISGKRKLPSCDVLASFPRRIRIKSDRHNFRFSEHDGRYGYVVEFSLEP